jgi:hypothetical protein
MDFSKLISTIIGPIITITSQIKASPFEVPQGIHNKLFESTDLSDEIVWVIASLLAFLIVAVITCIVLRPKQCCKFITYVFGFIFGCTFLVIFVFAVIMLIAFMKDHYGW